MLTALSLASSFAADSVTVQLQAVPASVKLRPGEKQQVMLIARNGSSESIHLLGFDWISTAGVSAMNRSGDRLQLTPQGAVYWLVELNRTNDSHETAAVQFRLDYRQSNSSNEIVGCALASLEIQNANPVSLDQVAEVRAESSMTQLQSPRSGIVYIVVKNKSDLPIIVGSIHARVPPDLIVTNATANQIVPARTEAAFPQEIRADRKVAPGKHLLLFEVNLAWNEDGRQQSGSALCKYESDVGVVLGDAHLIVPLGIPSFLLVPGFLMVIVFIMLWNFVHKDRTIPWDARTAEFWSLAVILSLIAVAIYRKAGTDLLVGYGFEDVYIVWCGSAVVAVVFWMVLEGGLRAGKAIQARDTRMRSFTADDEPVDVLRKLGRNDRRLTFKQVQLQLDSKDVVGLLLPAGTDGTQTDWIAPAVEFSFADRGQVQTLKDEFDELLKADRAKDLADWIGKRQPGEILVRWVPVDSLRRLRKVAGITFRELGDSVLVQRR